MRALLLAMGICGLGMSCALFKNAKVNNPMRLLITQPECRAMLVREPSYDEERTLGAALSLSVAQNGGFLGTKESEKPALEAMSEMGFHLAAFSERPEISWVFSLVDNTQPNAYSAPGGYVMVTRGMLSLVENETQLAAIVAHEIAHVTLRHALHVYRTSKAPICEAEKQAESLRGPGTLLKKGADKLIEKVLDPAIDAIVSKGLAQHDEFEADIVAVDLLVMAGYNPHEFIKVMAKFPNTKGSFPNHPSAKERQRNIEKHLSQSWSGIDFTKTPTPALDARFASLPPINATTPR